jgi:hypothetical protein
MNNKDQYFEGRRWRKVTPEEVESSRRAIENTFGIKRLLRGRPPKHPHLKYRDIHLKIHPAAFAWARAEAHRRGIGYQTLINQILLKRAA